MFYKNKELLAAMTKNLSSKNIAQLTDPCGSADHGLRNIKLSSNKLVRNYVTHFKVFIVMIIIETLIFSSVTPCSLVSCYHILRGTSCLNMKAEGSFRRC